MFLNEGLNVLQVGSPQPPSFPQSIVLWLSLCVLSSSAVTCLSCGSNPPGSQKMDAMQAIQVLVSLGWKVTFGNAQV
jgi:hypothetical protein